MANNEPESYRLRRLLSVYRAIRYRGWPISRYFHGFVYTCRTNPSGFLEFFFLAWMNTIPLLCNISISFFASTRCWHIDCFNLESMNRYEMASFQAVRTRWKPYAVRLLISREKSIENIISKLIQGGNWTFSFFRSSLGQTSAGFGSTSHSNRIEEKDERLILILESPRAMYLLTPLPKSSALHRPQFQRITLVIWESLPVVKIDGKFWTRKKNHTKFVAPSILRLGNFFKKHFNARHTAAFKLNAFSCFSTSVWMQRGMFEKCLKSWSEKRNNIFIFSFETIVSRTHIRCANARMLSERTLALQFWSWAISSRRISTPVSANTVNDETIVTNRKN